MENSNEVWNTAPALSRANTTRHKPPRSASTSTRTTPAARWNWRKFFETYLALGRSTTASAWLASHQPMLKWWVEPMLQYVNATFGPPSDFIYAIGSQTYFSGGHEAGESVDKILDDCHLSIGNQIDETGGVNEAGRIQWIEKPWTDLPAGMCRMKGPRPRRRSTTNIANRILAERSKACARRCAYNLDDAFLQLGGYPRHAVHPDRWLQPLRLLGPHGRCECAAPQLQV
ncbi:MAG: hypothetical protein IPG32_13550 [Saprospirales bacterium]|nr:hypothetical protein [Saprospirales bacterium]